MQQQQEVKVSALALCTLRLAVPLVHGACTLLMLFKDDNETVYITSANGTLQTDSSNFKDQNQRPSCTKVAERLLAGRMARVDSRSPVMWRRCEGCMGPDAPLRAARSCRCTTTSAYLRMGDVKWV